MAERLFAGVCLLVSSPILFFAAILIVVLSRKSPFVAHQRVGYLGKVIWVLKLRTMWKGEAVESFTLVRRLTPAEAPVLPPCKKNARVTSRFAAFCRRHSIDELPQLWQVLRGDMALIGPRPLTQAELGAYYGSDARYILEALPGLSGLWQVTGRSRLTYAQRRRLDVFLVRKSSIWLYFKILLITLPRVLSGKDAL